MFSFLVIDLYYLKPVWVYYHLVFLETVNYYLRLSLCIDPIDMKTNKLFVNTLKKGGTKPERHW